MGDCVPTMFPTVVRRMAATSKQGSGGLFENRLVNTFDPWLHRTGVTSLADCQHRAGVNARWVGKGLVQNWKFAPWAAPALVFGYYFIQDAIKWDTPAADEK